LHPLKENDFVQVDKMSNGQNVLELKLHAQANKNESVAMWQHGSQICVATFLSYESQKC